MKCVKCGASLRLHHILEDCEVPPMANNSKIIFPKCSLCRHPISINQMPYQEIPRRAILISGTAGAGKSALGQLISQRSDYIFIDGDAVSKRINYYARTYGAEREDCHAATISAMLATLALGYNTVVGYVITHEVLSLYMSALAQHKITPVFRILIPQRSVCIQRDVLRECWTAGDFWIDKWYDEQMSYLKTHPLNCIDSSNETLTETFEKHFRGLL